MIIFVQRKAKRLIEGDVLVTQPIVSDPDTRAIMQEIREAEHVIINDDWDWVVRLKLGSSSFELEPEDRVIVVIESLKESDA